jgi:hypothetical protein
MVADGRFYFQLMLSCLNHRLASFATNPNRTYHDPGFGHHGEHRYYEENVTTVGLHPGLAFRSDHESLDQILAHEVELYFEFARDT